MSVWVSSNRRRTGRRLGVAVAVVTLAGLSACSSKDDLNTANSQLDDANTQNSQLQNDLDTANSTNSSLAAENDANKAQVDQLTTQLAAETKRADDAEAQIAAAQAKFPVEVTSAVTEFQIIGNYTMTLTEAFCTGDPRCGTARQPINANIVQGSNGLEISVPTVLQTGLLPVNGNLEAGTDTDQILTCNGAPRNARALLTIFVSSQSIDNTGAKTLKTLGGSLFVEQHDTSDGCPDVSSFYGVVLTPAA
jgi:hypothetical protein